jgi:hypothetical protein
MDEEDIDWGDTGEEDYRDEDEEDWDWDCDEDDELIDGVGFADPGGRSALRAATEDNPRIYPCPDCCVQNRLTRIDVEHNYVCDDCADANERGF